MPDSIRIAVREYPRVKWGCAFRIKPSRFDPDGTLRDDGRVTRTVERWLRRTIERAGGVLEPRRPTLQFSDSDFWAERRRLFTWAWGFQDVDPEDRSLLSSRLWPPDRPARFLGPIDQKPLSAIGTVPRFV